MRKIMFFFLYLFCLPCGLLMAQSTLSIKHENKPLISTRIALADTNNNLLFSRQPKLREISMRFQNDTLYTVQFRYQELEKGAWFNEYYDMGFAGDAFIFNKRYGDKLSYMRTSTAFQSLLEEKSNCNENRQLQISLRKDSVILSFWVDCRSLLEENTSGKHRTELGVPAKYIGELNTLSAVIEKQFAETKNTSDIDSTIVFRGIVNVDGDLDDLVLEAGKESMFSKVVQRVLTTSEEQKTLKKAKSRWMPARISIGPVRSNIRIYTRLHEDGSLTMSTSRLLGTLSVLE